MSKSCNSGCAEKVQMQKPSLLNCTPKSWYSNHKKRNYPQTTIVRYHTDSIVNIDYACPLFKLEKRLKMDTIINLIAYLVVFGLFWWLVSLLPLPTPVSQVIRVLFIILLIYIIFSAFDILPSGYLPSLKLR